jgi:hypothetical protein
MKWLLAMLAGLVCAPSAMAQSVPFAGRWLLDAPADAQAAYTRLTVKGERMTWSGADKSAPGCVQEFALKQERPGTVYVDGRGTRFVAGMKGSIPTYLLQLRTSTCGGVGQDVRIRYPLVYDTTHIEVIDYVNGKPVGSRRFRRQGARQMAR